MADLGEFGRAVAEYVGEEPDTFRFHGEQFTVPASVSSLVLMRFAHSIKQVGQKQTAAQARSDNAKAVIDRARSPQEVHDATVAKDEADLEATSAVTDQLSAMYEYVLGCIGEDQFPAFEAVCVRDGVESEELMDVCAAIFSAVSGRPTRRPSESAGGPSSTGGTSRDDSGSPDGSRLRVITAQEPPVWGSEPEPESDAERQVREWRAETVPVADLLGIRSGT